MSNTFGQAYGLTLLSPIRGGHVDGGPSRDIAIREALRRISALGESPLASVATTHLARWVVIDDAPFEGYPATVDRFASKYLLFTSCFDGELAPYVELLRTRIPDTINAVYQHCHGFPGTSDARAFFDYITRCQVKTSFFFGAYPTASVDQVLRALEAQRRVARFIEQQQDAGPAPAALQQSFRDLMAGLRSAPTPRPGLL